MKDSITIKPHHFLDVIKLYGKGYEIFLPDENYNHDFYKIGNIILEDKNTMLALTIDFDDMCRPCKFLKNGKCIDMIENRGKKLSKDVYNKVIDIRILNQLGLKENQQLTALEFCSIAREKLKVLEIWKEEPKEKVAERQKNLLLGLEKYMNEPKNF